jgi:hypothetical protein
VFILPTRFIEVIVPGFASSGSISFLVYALGVTVPINFRLSSGSQSELKAIFYASYSGALKILEVTASKKIYTCHREIL